MCIIQRTRFNRACIFFMREAVPHSGFADRLHSTTTVGVSPLCRNWMGKGWRRGGQGRNFFTDHRMVMKIGSDPSYPSIPPRQRPSPPVNGIGRARVCERRPRARDISNIHLTRYFFSFSPV